MGELTVGELSVGELSVWRIVRGRIVRGRIVLPPHQHHSAVMLKGFQGGGRNWVHMMPREVSLSDN